MLSRVPLEARAPKAGEIVKEYVRKFGKRAYDREFIRPDGKVDVYFMFEGLKPPAMIFALTEDMQVVGLRQFRTGSNKFMIEIPGGCPNESESPEESVRREFREETGYEPAAVRRVGPRCWFDPVSCSTPYTPFLATGCRKVGEPDFDESEIAEVVVVPLAEWIEMFHRGEMDDTKTGMMTLLGLLAIGAEIKF